MSSHKSKHYFPCWHQLQKQRYMKYYTSCNPFFQAVCAEKRKEDL